MGRRLGERGDGFEGAGRWKVPRHRQARLQRRPERASGDDQHCQQGGSSQAAVIDRVSISGASYRAVGGSINAETGVSTPNLVLATFQILDKTKVASLHATATYSDGSVGAASIIAAPGVLNGYEVVGNHVFSGVTPAGGGVTEVTVSSTSKQGRGFTLSDPTVVTPSNTWTIMVYMEADNSLETYAIPNLIQMEEAAAELPGTVHFVVFLHQENDPTTGQPGILTASGTQAWTGMLARQSWRRA